MLWLPLVFKKKSLMSQLQDVWLYSIPSLFQNVVWEFKCLIVNSLPSRPEKMSTTHRPKWTLTTVLVIKTDFSSHFTSKALF